MAARSNACPSARAHGDFGDRTPSLCSTSEFVAVTSHSELISRGAIDGWVDQLDLAVVEVLPGAIGQ
jgi:hypothetical protein